MANSILTGPTTGEPYRIDLASRVGVRSVGAGVLVAITSQIVLMLLGTAIGLSSLEETAEGPERARTGLLLWMLLSVVVTMFLGGWVATITSRSPERRDGLLHGLVTWAAASLIGLFLVGGVLREMVGGALSFVSFSELARPRTEDLAVGFWGLFATLVVSLIAALLGGLAGSRSEAQKLGREVRTRSVPTTPAVPQPT